MFPHCALGASNHLLSFPAHICLFLERMKEGRRGGSKSEQRGNGHCCREKNGEQWKRTRGSVGQAQFIFLWRTFLFFLFFVWTTICTSVFFFSPFLFRPHLLLFFWFWIFLCVLSHSRSVRVRHLSPQQKQWFGKRIKNENCLNRTLRLPFFFSRLPLPRDPPLISLLTTGGISSLQHRPLKV